MGMAVLSSAKGAVLPCACSGRALALARVLGSGLRGAFATAGGSSSSLLPRRWASSLPQQLEPADRSDEESGGEIDWDNLGFGLTPTDYMYVMRCSLEDCGVFSGGKLSRYGNIELSPSSGVLNYGQGLFEGMKAHRRPDRAGYTLFRPEENARRMQHGAERMCMPAPSVEQFVDAVKQTVLANRRWVPPQGKGALYLRPLLIGSGPILGLAPAPEYTFLIYAAPVGNYFKEGLAPINLVIEDGIHRAMPGGTGGVKTITNYAPVLKPQMDAKSKGFTDVLYLDSVHKRYLEEVSSCNVFVVKGGVVATPATRGTILPGITRKSVIELATDRGYKVEERLVSIDDLMDADEVFCTGTAVVVAPVSTVTYQGQKYDFRTGPDTVSQKLHTALTSIQMGLAEDKKGWTVAID
ncbi:branched-chain-amino-acid aminotransferase 2, chloroplastic-like [Phragmites australis]|uniref:branched-chain-amino-acid aminotransferase 2, chloroplastic-like n=1 Tax=Phragmites australis TaxID=29695 RepID=UPI002D77B722|nr:branched-chain-amino-acid aminotransferase 2, chloroplastic-like [Phragmites australis]XP_062210458.1 branched-chain-amino-acid aminotransferase 2, chloroplastic-like [Phragmites australis]